MPYWRPPLWGKFPLQMSKQIKEIEEADRQKHVHADQRPQPVSSRYRRNSGTTTTGLHSDRRWTHVRGHQCCVRCKRFAAGNVISLRARCHRASSCHAAGGNFVAEPIQHTLTHSNHNQIYPFIHRHVSTSPLFACRRHGTHRTWATTSIPMDGGTFAFGLYAPLGNLFQAQTNKYETLSYIHHRV